MLIENLKLPPPLKKVEQEQLFQRLEKGDTSVINCLMEHNLRQIVSVIKNYLNEVPNHEDLLQIGAIGLRKAIKTFDLSKQYQFSTYANRVILNEMLMYIRKQKKQKQECSYNSIIFEKDDGELVEYIDTLESNALGPLDTYLTQELTEEQNEVYHNLFECISELPKRDGMFLLMYYGIFDGHFYSQVEISKIYGLHQSYVSRILKKDLELLKEKLEKRGYSKEIFKSGCF